MSKTNQYKMWVLLHVNLHADKQLIYVEKELYEQKEEAFGEKSDDDKPVAQSAGKQPWGPQIDKTRFCISNYSAIDMNV